MPTPRATQTVASTTEMNGATAADLTFGVEIETHIPNSRHIVGGYRCGRTVPGVDSFEGRSWTAQQDGSIHYPYGRQGCEFVSPILKGEAGMTNLIGAIRAIRTEYDARVNASCGFHVHVGFPRGNRDALRRLVHLVSNFETALYAVTGTRNRQTSQWCRSIKRSLRNVRWDRLAPGSSRRPEGFDGDRYRLFNIVPLTEGRGTVEFRVFSATLNATKAAAFVQVCLALVEIALNTRNAVSWDSTADSDTLGPNAGPGERAVNRLLYRIGWTQGRARPFGLILPENQTSDHPKITVNTMKRMLRALAAQYDGRLARNAARGEDTEPEAVENEPEAMTRREHEGRDVLPSAPVETPAPTVSPLPTITPESATRAVASVLSAMAG